MMIFPANDFVFVHIPKTGGSSFKLALQAKGNRYVEYWGPAHGFDQCHLTLAQIEKWCPDLWKKVTAPKVLSLSIVRHPFSRAMSAYKWFLQTTNYYLSLESYLVSSSKLAEWDHRFIHAVPQHRYLYHKGKNIVGEIIKLENIGEQIPIIRGLLFNKGISLNDMPRINIGDRVDSSFETPVMWKLIEKFYDADFDLLGYDRAIPASFSN